MTNSSLMSIKEVSEVLNVSKSLVIKRVKELYPELMKASKKTLLTEAQVTAIKMRISQNSSIATVHDRERLADMPSTDLEMLILQKKVDKWRDERIVFLENKTEQLQIELDEHKAWFSVKRIMELGYLKDEDPRKVWRPLKKWCVENDYKIISIFDSNYGTVKTYHRDAWNSVYGIEV